MYACSSQNGALGARADCKCCKYGGGNALSKQLAAGNLVVAAAVGMGMVVAAVVMLGIGGSRII